MHQRRTRVRLLGDLEVTRADQSTVGLREYRTGKTADLLRILALNNGHQVPLSDVIHRLWPDVTPEKARASLRTAISQLRRAVGVDCVGRRAGTLLLLDSWVDVDRFLANASAARQASRAGRHLRALILTQAAERRYRGDFHAHDDESGWARGSRDRLVRTRQQTLVAGAEGAIALARFTDSLELASIAVALDRRSESAHRALMLSYAELGEIGSALRVFESYRETLAEEFGADPSVQTRELHLRLLRGEPH